MFERIRLGSAAALAVSLTMVGSGIYTATQDSEGGGDGTTVDLASSVGSRTPTASPAVPAGAGPLARLEGQAGPEPDPPGPRVGWGHTAPPTATVVTVEADPPPRSRSGPPTDKCYGYVSNASGSDSNVVAETNNATHVLQPGDNFDGSATELVIGFYIPEGETQVDIKYFSYTGGEYLSTHDVDVDAPRSFDVDMCHEATVDVTDPNQDPLVDVLTPDEPRQDPLMPGLDPVPDPAPDAAAADPDLEVPIPQFDN